jgi:branched-chain amino acid transport system substrate-binding protein
VFYQRGLVIGMILAEGIKAAQAKFSAKVVNPEQLRWGLENLKIDDAKLAELGMTGMVVPFTTTCADHTGHGGAWILEWDGAKFNKASDLLMPDRAAIAPLEAATAKEYAEANAPWPTNSECQM